LTRRTKARFVGSIRLVPEVDSIGVPIFIALRGNEIFVPEMNGDFRIVRFLEFYNEQRYTICYDLPYHFNNQTYSIGSSTPIPFWISNECHVIVGDADKEEPYKLFGDEARHNSVLLDLARLLDDARSGRIKDRFDEWTSENIANGFADVFFETPVRSRYWVTRYRVAVAKARKLAKPPHPIDNKLRHVAGEWFRRFGTKTDLSKIGGMLGNSANEILSKRQMTDILFAFLMNKLLSKDFADIDAYLKEPTLHKAFPRGLYHYYIENGWPRVPFEYKRTTRLVEIMMNELANGYDNEDFEWASQLTFFLFGLGPLPEEVDGQARAYLKEVMTRFGRLRKEAKYVLSNAESENEWAAYAEGLLDYYDQLMDLDGIVNAEERLKRVPFDKRFGVALEYLNDLKRIKRRDW
jgi:hypothetical protein